MVYHHAIQQMMLCVVDFVITFAFFSNTLRHFCRWFPQRENFAGALSALASKPPSQGVGLHKKPSKNLLQTPTQIGQSSEALKSKASTQQWNKLTRNWSWKKVLVEAKVGFVTKSVVVDFLPTQIEAVHLSFFPTMTKEPGTAKSSTRPKVTTLRRGNGALETRPLSHLQARNSVVLSTLLKVVLMNGIARKKRYTVATSSRRPMDVSVSQQTMEDINTVYRKTASTNLRGG